MRFLRQKRETAEILPVQLNTENQPWCREARLICVKGTGVLRWEGCGERRDSDWGTLYLSRLTLRGTPLLFREYTGSPTCESLLAAGLGLAAADCPELKAVREALNGGFDRLEEAVPALTPLLGLLEPGLYVLADGTAYPADGGGRFFWDVPDGRAVAPATAQVGLMDDDFESEYPPSAPVFLYPSQRRSRLDPARVEFYMERARQDGPPPRGIALHIAEGLSILLDGHHKAAAAARLGRTLPCLTVFPAAYSYQMVRTPGRPQALAPAAVWFGPFFHIRVRDLPGRYLPRRPLRLVKGPRGRLDGGCLADRDWPAEYRAAGAKYPTAQEYALVTAAGIGYPTDEELERWLSAPREYRPQLRAALVLLREGDDPRLKKTALRCAALRDCWCSLVEEAFRVLAAMGGDPDAEDFFVDYFIELETLPQDRPRGSDILTEIAHSFWA